MVDSSNNTHVNTFVGGMNLDVSNALLPDNSYREAYNLRLTTDVNSNTGALHSIEGVRFVETFSFPQPPQYYNNYEVIHVDSIRNYGVIFTKNVSTSGNGPVLYSIFRFVNTEEPTQRVVTKIFGPVAIEMGPTISTVTRWEDSDNVKVYFADGVSPIRSINIAPSQDTVNQSLVDDSSLTIYPSVTFPKMEFMGLGTGLLKTGSVQYGYQLFNKNGSETEVSILTDMIQLNAGPLTINNSKECSGAEKGQQSGKSVKLNVDLADVSGFSGIKIVSLFYEDNVSVPKISVLANLDIPSTKLVRYEDVTGKALYTMTLEEFNLISGVHFAPRLIEVKNNHLFASDITYLDNTFDVDYDARAYRYHPASASIADRKTQSFCVLIQNGTNITFTQKDIESGTKVLAKTDDIILPYNDVNKEYNYFLKTHWDKLSSTDKQKLDKFKCCTFIDDRPDGSKQALYGGKGVNVRYRFIVGDLEENTKKMDAQINFDDNNSESLAASFEGVWVSNVTFEGQLVNKRFISATETPITSTCNYSNPLISYKFKSLQRDEVYRYAVVFYNKYGQASPAKWIGDIRTPSVIDTGFESFLQNKSVSFRANSSDNRVVGLAVRPIGIEFELENVPTDVVSYEIVRCERKAEDRSSLTQGIISKTMSGETSSSTNPVADDYKNKVFPLDIVTLNSKYGPKNTIGQNPLPDMKYKSDGLVEAYSNNYFTFASPEICYSYDNFKSTYKNSTLKLSTRKAIASLYSAKTNTKIKIANCTGGSVTDTSGTIAELTDASNITWYTLPIQYRGTSSNTFKMYAQSNVYNTYSSINAEGTRQTEVGYDYEISNQLFPKELNWNDYKNKFDFSEPFSNVSFCNWCTTNLGQDRTRENTQGPGGRTMVANVPSFGFQPLINRLDQAVENAGQIEYADANTYANNIKKSDTFSTLVCNLKQNTVPYGGGTYSSIENATYISTGSYSLKKQNNKLDVFGGDTYIGVFDYVKAHKFYTNESITEYEHTSFLNYYIPVESSINLSLTFGPEFHKDKQGDVQIEPGNINNQFTQTKPLYSYNVAYSAQSTGKFHTPASRYDESNKHIDVRTHFSQVKSNDEIIDSWTKFLPLNYLDVDTRYGGITNIRTFGNELMYWQESAFGRYSVADRALITDENVGELILGTGGILTRYDYIATMNGMSRVDQDSDTQSDTVLYWYDRDKCELCVYTGGGVRCISKLRYVQSYLSRLRNMPEHKVKPFLVFDKEYNELLCSLSNNETLVYNEPNNVFTGFYTIVPDNYLYFDKDVYMIKNNSLYKYNADVINSGFDGHALPVELKYVVNPHYNYVKVFDNSEFTGVLLKENIHSIACKTETLIGEPVIPANISNREFSYRFAIPRVQSTEKFANRLRGRALECKFKYNLINQSDTYLATHQSEYLNTYDNTYMVANRREGEKNVQVQRYIDDYNLSDKATQIFELPYIKTTFRISRS